MQGRNKDFGGPIYFSDRLSKWGLKLYQKIKNFPLSRKIIQEKTVMTTLYSKTTSSIKKVYEQIS